tara:strand:+ start:788 stop:970 length:183 start_codon:yes stop_codon:yes gene_type:complete
MSYDLLNYKEARIDALLRRINVLELENEKITTYIFELCDKDCPSEYKKIIQNDVFNGQLS